MHAFGGGSGGGGGYAATGELEQITPYQNYSISIGNGGSGGVEGRGNPSSITYNECCGKTGGTTTAFGKTANGGGGALPVYLTNWVNGSGSTPGSGNGNGGKGAWVPDTSDSTTPTSAGQGTNGTQMIYTSFSDSALCGGGGGGGGYVKSYGTSMKYVLQPGANGGSPSGGAGGSCRITGSDQTASDYVSFITPSSGSLYGGGGGGGNCNYSNSYSSNMYASIGGGNGGRGCVSIRIYHVG